jgi:PE family
MSLVIAPDLVENAAGDLAAIRSSLSEATAAAVTPTTGVISAAQDEVSVAIASLFGNAGEQFQALSAQAQAFHQQFVSLISSSAGAYTSAEAANAAQTLLDGGVFGGIEQSISGAVSGAQSALGQLGLNISGGFTALSNGSLGAALSGQIQADVGLASTAIANVPANFAGALQTGGQAIAQAGAGFGAQFGALEAGGFSGAANSLSAFGSSVLAPYQALVTNTVSNLQAIGSTITSNPFPFLHQVINNQIYYAQNALSALGNGIANLPAELAGLPQAIQSALQSLSTFNPGTYVQQFINNQIGYAQTVLTSLQSGGTDLLNGLQQLPAGFETALQDLLVGNNVGAYQALNQTLLNGFLPGLNAVLEPTGIVDVTPQGFLGDLAPILAIPGEMAQNFTNLLPAGSIPALMSQNATNLISSVLNFGTTLNLNGATIPFAFGVPLQLVLDTIGAPGNALAALNSTGVALATSLQAGNVSGALGALIDAPANMLNGFLNGSTVATFPPAVLSGLPSITAVNLGGLLTPLTLPSLSIDIGGTLFPFTLDPVSTGVGGLIPGLLSLDQQLAQVIALPAPILPPFVF